MTFIKLLNLSNQTYKIETVEGKKLKVANCFAIFIYFIIANPPILAGGNDINLRSPRIWTTLGLLLLKHRVRVTSGLANSIDSRCKVNANSDQIALSRFKSTHCELTSDSKLASLNLLPVDPQCI